MCEAKKNDELNEVCTFKPKTNTKSKNRRSLDVFYTHMRKFEEKRDKKIEKIKKQLEDREVKAEPSKKPKINPEAPNRLYELAKVRNSKLSKSMADLHCFPSSKPKTEQQAS